MTHVAVTKGPVIAPKEFRTRGLECNVTKPNPLDKKRRTMKAEHHSGQVGLEFCLSKLEAGTVCGTFLHCPGFFRFRHTVSS